ncbi:wd40 repeat-containing protein smu1 [Lichtheimia corymbifera JMRC:FSU:9682]|uniref:Wd40 repeat-containing protein smu1 n=1 Tax=Lichtheimia corymbifera JMRC:FSU:9682 TaxID=1263082 RepID=A0A068S1A0_9FUNG|nr:wd40 repeat-containing protein smu1 [Lichtheimia corymbifera JMRC:FSU:9682]
MSVEIEAEDVIRLILQFFKENNLDRSLATLSEETMVNLNTIDNRSAFVKDITEGKWDTVLKDIVHLNIAPRKLIDLYEQVVIELCEMRELGAARTLLRQTEPMHIMKQRHPERYLRLEHLLSRTVFDPKDVYTEGMTKEKRRKIIAQALVAEITVVPSSRLLTLLSQSATWQQHQGLLSPDTPFNPFERKSITETTEKDAPALEKYATIKFPSKKTYAECATFSPNGQYLVTGSVDGFIEVWNYRTGKLRKDLIYQNDENLMAMDESVICLSFSRDSEQLVSGSTDGKIAIWRIQSGTCQRKISPAHSQGVTSVCFNKDNTCVLSGSYDRLVKLHDIRNGKLLTEFKGHTSFVNDVLFSTDNTKVISGSSDGSIKIWDSQDASCLYTIQPNTSNANHPVHRILNIPKHPDQLAVCYKSASIQQSTMNGRIIKSYKHSNSASDYVSIAMSPQGELVYGISEDSRMACFSMASGELAGDTKVGDNTELIGIASHPFSNIIAVYDDSGHVYLYSAKH